VRRIGFLADTHSRKADGSDLPQQALDAFAGVDLIVHLGDIGQKGILDRLAEVAPVLVPAGGDRGWVSVGGDDASPLRVIEAGGTSVGLTFNVSKPDKAIMASDTGLQFGDKPLAELLRKRFSRTVNVVALPERTASGGRSARACSSSTRAARRCPSTVSPKTTSAASRCSS